MGHITPDLLKGLTENAIGGPAPIGERKKRATMLPAERKRSPTSFHDWELRTVRGGKGREFFAKSWDVRGGARGGVACGILSGGRVVVQTHMKYKGVGGRKVFPGKVRGEMRMTIGSCGN